MKSPSLSSVYVGVDVGKSTLAVAFHGEKKTTEVPNTAAGLKALLKTLADAEQPIALVVLESTGGYERPLRTALLKAGIPTHRADPRKASLFLRSIRRDKSDSLDALGLARYAAERDADLRRDVLESPTQETLKGLMRRLQSLVQMRAHETTRQQAPQAAMPFDTFKPILNVLNKQISKLEAEMDRLIQSDPLLASRVAVLTSVKGVGTKTARVLVAAMPELGSITRKQTAALAGLAPIVRESGAFKGSRRTQGGRREVRSALYMAALAATRFNPTLKAFYERLTARGKKPIVALIATARKLLTILNAQLRDSALSSSILQQSG